MMLIFAAGTQPGSGHMKVTQEPSMWYGGKILEFIQICQIAPHKSYTRATPSNGEGRAQNASDRAFIRECQQPLS